MGARREGHQNVPKGLMIKFNTNVLNGFFFLLTLIEYKGFGVQNGGFGRPVGDAHKKLV